MCENKLTQNGKALPILIIIIKKPNPVELLRFKNLIIFEPLENFSL